MGWAGPNATGTRGGLRCPRVRPCLRTAGPGRAAQGRGHERLPCEAGMLGLASSSRAPGCFALLRAFASWPAGRRAAAAEHQHDPAAARSRTRWGQNPAEVTASRGLLGAAGHKNYQVAGRCLFTDGGATGESSVPVALIGAPSGATLTRGKGMLLVAPPGVGRHIGAYLMRAWNVPDGAQRRVSYCRRPD